MDSSLENECEIVKVQKESRVPEDVTFHDANDDCYPIGQDVRCSYKILASLKPSSYDWVGLFKAGSSLPSEYVHYEWSPLPKDYVKGTDVENAVVFPEHRMPTEDGKLYQFSYISANGKTCGTSKPFRLKMLKSDEFLESTEEGEEEEKDGELVVIETKTLTLEAKIREATEENRTLKEKLGYMDDAAAGVVENQNQLEEELRGVKEQIEQLKSRLQEKTAAAESRELENKTLELCIVQLEEKVSGLNKENSQLLDRTVAHDAYVMELEEELMESRMKYSDVMDQLLSTTNLCEEYKCEIAAKENEFKELDLKLGALDEEKEKMMNQLSDNTVFIDDLESCVAILTGSRNELRKRADRVEEENRHFQASTFVSLKVLSDQQREAADRMKSDLEKRLVEETATSARMMKMAEELKEKLLRHLLEKEKEDKIHQQERAKLEKCVAEQKASSLSSKKLAAELKEQLQKHLSEREREMKAAEVVKADLEKRLTEEMASSQRSKKLEDELKDRLLTQIYEREEEKKAFEKIKAELEKCFLEEITASGRAKETTQELEEKFEKRSPVFFELMALKGEKAELEKQLSEEKTKAKEKQLLIEELERQLLKTEQEKKEVEQKNEYLIKCCSEEHVMSVDRIQSLKDCEERLEKLLSEKEEETKAAKDENAKLENRLLEEITKSDHATETVHELEKKLEMLLFEGEEERLAAEKEMAKPEKRLSAEVDSSMHRESWEQQKADDASTLMIEQFEKSMADIGSRLAGERAYGDLLQTELNARMKALKKCLSEERTTTGNMVDQERAEFQDCLLNETTCFENVKSMVNEERSAEEHGQRMMTEGWNLQEEMWLKHTELVRLANEHYKQAFSMRLNASDHDTVT